MAKTPELEVDEAHLLTTEENVVGARIAMNVGEEWPRSFNSTAHRLELLQKGRLAANRQSFETGLGQCDAVMKLSAGPGNESCLGVQVMTEALEAYRVTAGRCMQFAETGCECEQRGGRAGGILFEERFDQAPVRPQIFEDEEACGTIPRVKARAAAGDIQDHAQELRPDPVAEKPPNIPRCRVSRVVVFHCDLLDNETGGGTAREITAPQHDVPPAFFSERCNLA